MLYEKPDGQLAASCSEKATAEVTEQHDPCVLHSLAGYSGQVQRARQMARAIHFCVLVHSSVCWHHIWKRSIGQRDSRGHSQSQREQTPQSNIAKEMEGE